jgi:hypothetical protein
MRDENEEKRVGNDVSTSAAGLRDTSPILFLYRVLHDRIRKELADLSVHLAGFVMVGVPRAENLKPTSPFGMIDQMTCKCHQYKPAIDYCRA